MISKTMRNNQLFMRNSFPSVGKWGIPLVKKQALPSDNINLLACSDTRSNDSTENRKRGVHFFVDDYRFENTYNNPARSLKRYSTVRFCVNTRLLYLC